MSEQPPRPPTFRADIIIALSALGISTLACVAAVMQTRVIAQQLSATVWPYLNFSSSSTSNTGKAKGLEDEGSITVTNDGLGPAIIQSATIMLDGRRLPSIDSAVATIVSMRRKAAGSTTSSSIGGGSVIRPGETVTLIDIKGNALVAPYRRRLPGLSIAICYCSILRTCWLVRSHEQEPHDVASCEA